MANTLRSSRRNRRSRPVVGMRGLPRPVTPIEVLTAEADGVMITLTFNQPVVLDGVPSYLTSVSGPVPVNASRPAPNMVTVLYSASVETAAWVRVPFRDPAVRNGSGGFVNPQSVTM